MVYDIFEIHYDFFFFQKCFEFCILDILYLYLQNTSLQFRPFVLPLVILAGAAVGAFLYWKKLGCCSCCCCHFLQVAILLPLPSVWFCCHFLSVLFSCHFFQVSMFCHFIQVSNIHFSNHNTFLYRDRGRGDCKVCCYKRKKFPRFLRFTSFHLSSHAVYQNVEPALLAHIHYKEQPWGGFLFVQLLSLSSKFLCSYSFVSIFKTPFVYL